MLSSVASRSLLRGSKASHARAFASFGFPSATGSTSDNLTTTQVKIAHSNSHSTSFQSQQIHSLAAAHRHSLNRPVILQRQHPATPVFVAFAPYSAPETKEDMSVEEDDTAMREAIMDEEESESQEMSNRNNRSSKKHKANHGKRPCNRNARRAKLIKLGRRRRS